VDHVIKTYQPIIKDNGVELIEYLDDNFFVDLEWAEKVANGLGVPYRALIRADRINEEVCDLLNRTKCRALFMGIESGNDRVRNDIMNKNMTGEQIKNALRMLNERCPHINISAMFIMGIPGEKYEEFRDTCRFAMEISDIHPRLLVQANTYAPYPKCKSYLDAVCCGWDPPEKTEGWILDSKPGSDLEPTWLDWYYGGLKKKFDLTAEMFLLLRKSNDLGGFKDIAKKILEMCARFRLRYDFYFFPIEMKAFWFLYKKFIKSDIVYEEVKQ
jgi:radical SAM superfamily enzyme YgiQ (UPF0313 family)